MLNRLARVVLVAALLAGWQSALVHPLTHVDKHGGFVHLGGQQQKKTDSSGLCNVIAALAACAPSSVAIFIPIDSSQAVSVPFAAVPRIAEAPPFLAQGPPSVL
jgi:hypothetical protein